MEGLVVSFEIYKNKKVLITGHTGFKGSWLSLWLHRIGAEVAGYSLPPEEMSHFNLLKLPIKNYFNDINDEVSLKKAFNEFKPDIVFHLAAQPLVRDSYLDPITTYTTNIIGSLKVYQAALEADVKALVSITTDKVYENKEWERPYKEDDQLGGYDPYSSSKACVEILSESFKRSFLNDNKMLMATARAGNVIGGGDWAKDRLIPDLVKNASRNLVTPIRNINSIRPWQHVLDPLNGYLKLGEKLLQGETLFCTSFNFGPSPAENLTVQNVCDIAMKSWDQIQYKETIDHNSVHEAKILKLDISKSYQLLNWKPVWKNDTAVKETIVWYRDYTNMQKVQSEKNLQDFISILQRHEK